MKLSFRPLAAVVFAACAALVGCGPKPEPPEAVAEKVFKSVFVEHNFEAAKPFVSGDALKEVEEMQKVCKELPPEVQAEIQTKIQKMKEAFVNATPVEKTLGDSAARIVYRVEGVPRCSLHLVKVSGVWKVDRLD